MSLYVSVSKYMSRYRLDVPYPGLFIRGGKGLKLGALAAARPLIGWHVASALSITECKQVSDWLLASPHWAA